MVNSSNKKKRGRETSDRFEEHSALSVLTSGAGNHPGAQEKPNPSFSYQPLRRLHGHLLFQSSAARAIHSRPSADHITDKKMEDEYVVFSN